MPPAVSDLSFASSMIHRTPTDSIITTTTSPSPSSHQPTHHDSRHTPIITTSPPRHLLKITTPPFGPLSPWWRAVGGGSATTRRRSYITSKNSIFLPIFSCMGLSAAKPPSWWRSNDGTTTIAAPCGVGL
nr:hypothetical protein [Tanacetum cinerariifolium]